MMRTRNPNPLDVVMSEGHPILMAHVYSGDPTAEFSHQLIRTLTSNGVDIIEFGIPFSDPTSDGVTFQRACKRALDNGMTPQKAIEGISRLRADGVRDPIVVTSYYNILHNMGVDVFIRRICEAGANAVLVPDLPIEEADQLLAQGAHHDIRVVLMISPNTPDHRLDRILRHASGLLYLTSVMGVTGVREQLQPAIEEVIRRVAQRSPIPILVGFGISKPEHAARVVCSGAAGVVIGSAICQIYDTAIDAPSTTLNQIGHLVRSIKDGCIQGLQGRVGQ
ncbi:MAG: tryptophan synthase subunit alpha [Candidatus Thorarchaeota archaeon]|nr:tryptophan synthase subunit alpha [Candidatus Thorarchaeota archaeon]